MPHPKEHWRLAVVATHPIQHFVSFYRALHEVPAIELHVLFGSRIGLKSYFDREMNAHINWNMDLTSGYPHSFLPEADAIKSSRFFDLNNPSVGGALNELNPDAVIVYGYANMTALRTIAWAVRRRIPLLMISDSEPVHQRSLWKAAIKRRLLRALVKRVDAFLTVGDNNEAYWASYGASREKMFRTPFTIDEDSYIAVRQNRENVRADWRRKHNIPDSDIVFLTVGKVSPRKRQKDLVEALRLARDISDMPMHVVIAGDGSERGDIEALARLQKLPVTLPGFVNVDELPKVYAAADVLVHTSERDPHPLVMSEAACMGLPVITSDRVGAVGPTDILRPGENALVYPVTDIGALARHMVALASSAGIRAIMAEASLRIFLSQNTAASLDGVLKALRSFGTRGVAMDSGRGDDNR